MIGFYILLSISIVLNMVLFLFVFKTLKILYAKVDYVLNKFILVARQSGVDEGNRQGIKEQKAIQKEIDDSSLKEEANHNITGTLTGVFKSFKKA